MPIFEHNDEMSDKEFRRQQEVLNQKMKRMEEERQKDIEQLERMFSESLPEV